MDNTEYLHQQPTSRRIILKRILDKQDKLVWTVFTWLKMAETCESGREPLGFHKMLEILELLCDFGGFPRTQFHRVIN
jgi:hypothetical protein